MSGSNPSLFSPSYDYKILYPSSSLLQDINNADQATYSDLAYDTLKCELLDTKISARSHHCKNTGVPSTPFA